MYSVGRRPFARQQDAELALSDQAEQVDVDHPAREAVVLVIRPAQAGEVLADRLDRDLPVALAGLGLDPLVEVLDELVALGVELLGAVLLHDAQGIAVVVGGAGELVGLGALGDVPGLDDAVDDLDRFGVVERSRGVEFDLRRLVDGIQHLTDREESGPPGVLPGS